ncbi:putative membrane protein (Precursor) [Nocardioides sp. PD653]|nr:Putative membrane protein (Precursor) [Nocardioides sp. PD653-B2]GAW55595.1 putative membrane protein (Precursor) [Nocardioides sp. PD653]
MSTQTTRTPATRLRRSLSALVDRVRGRRDEVGAIISVWTIAVASGVFLILLGLVYDGGNAMNNRISAHRSAEQAARAAADTMRGLRDGDESVNPATAVTRADQILAQAGWHGTVTINGLDVTVRVTGKSQNVFLGVIGFNSFPIDETGHATSITGPK